MGPILNAERTNVFLEPLAEVYSIMHRLLATMMVGADSPLTIHDKKSCCALVVEAPELPFVGKYRRHSEYSTSRLMGLV